MLRLKTKKRNIKVTVLCTPTAISSNRVPTPFSNMDVLRGSFISSKSIRKEESGLRFASNVCPMAQKNIVMLIQRTQHT